MSTETSEERALRQAWKAAGGSAASYERARKELDGDRRQAAVTTLNSYLREQADESRQIDSRWLPSRLRDE